MSRWAWFYKWLGDYWIPQYTFMLCKFSVLTMMWYYLSGGVLYVYWTCMNFSFLRLRKFLLWLYFKCEIMSALFFIWFHFSSYLILSPYKAYCLVIQFEINNGDTSSSSFSFRVILAILSVYIYIYFFQVVWRIVLEFWWG